MGSYYAPLYEGLEQILECDRGVGTGPLWILGTTVFLNIRIKCI
jgi:hypothetical protein